MVALNFQTIRIFLLGILCIHLTFGRSVPGPAWDPSAYNGQVSQNLGFGLGLGVDTGFTGGLNIGGGFGGFGAADFSLSSFTDVLFNQLVESNVFRNFFSSPITTDLSLNIGLAISQSLVSELGLSDSYLATNLLSSALTSVIPGSGPEAYGRALANTVGKILLNNSLLNSGNSSSLANTLARIILNAVSVSLYGNVGVNVGAGLGGNFGGVVTTGVNTNVGSNIGVNEFGYSAGRFIDGGASILGGGLDINAGLDLDAGVGLGVGVDAGLGLGIGTNAGLGIGSGAGLGIGANVGLGAGVGANVGLDIGAGLGIGTNAGLGVGAGLGIGADVGLGIGADVGLGIGANAGLGAAVNTGIGAGLNVGAAVDTSLGVNVNTGLNLGLDLGLGVDVGLDTDTSVGLSIDFSVSDDANALFQSSLQAELLKDKFFRDVFSDYIPPSALKQIGAAISQYLSKAFSLPRSFLLPLENSIANLSFDVAPSAEIYAAIISNSVTTLFSSVNFITNGTARLQWTIAANAITSGIANFLGISTIPGIGLGVNGNSYNSYFSVLNGLEKLPYVGIDAVSSTLPPIVKTVQASAFASQFSKTLFYNLVSSNKFSEAFSLGVPTYTYKIIASSLGKFMAEAFGSSDPAIFTDIYTKALVATIDKLNCRTYARALSLATTKALYLLGYFLSGNVNIQAAIATNAIIRALQTRLRPVLSQVTLFPGITRLPWVLQLAGVAPSQTLTKFGISVDSGAGVGLGVDVGMNAGVGVGIDADAGINADVGIGVGAGLGLGAGLGVGAGLGLGSGLGLDLGLGSGLDIGVGAGVGLGLGVDAGVGAGLGLGLDAGVGTGLGVGLEADLGLGGQSNTGLGVGVGLDVGLGAGLDLGLGLSGSNRKKFNRQKRSFDDSLFDDLDFDFDADFDLEAELEAELELLSDLNLGLDLDADVGVGAKVDAKTNVGVDVGANVGTNVRTNAGVSAGLGLGSNLREATGVGLGAGLGVAVGVGVDAGVGVSAGLDAAAGVQTGADLGFSLGPKTPSSSNLQLSVLNVLPQILANKLYQSTTLYTAVSMVGTRKVVNLIAQALASGFGLPVASIFLRSYNQYSANNVNNSFGISTIALALSATEALAGAGILNSSFSVLTADQLATAVVSKFSSLIATSLDTKDLGLRPRWTYIFSQDQFQPPLSPGYNIFK